MPASSAASVAGLDSDVLRSINKAGKRLAELRAASIEGKIDLDAMTNEEWHPSFRNAT